MNKRKLLEQGKIAFRQAMKDIFFPRKIEDRDGPLYKEVYDCSKCDYAADYGRPRGIEHICLNYDSKHYNNSTYWLEQEKENMSCVVINGKSLNELLEMNDSDGTRLS